jgi:hypothetical protein
VYRKGAGGQLTEVGSSGNLPGQKELVEIPNASAGTYVLRVVNYASAAPEYTLTAGLFATSTRWTAGRREAYTLTCEKNGKVLQTARVYVDRGVQKQIDLTKCRRRW